MAHQHTRSALRLAVGIATVGRPQLLANLLQVLRRQSRPPDALIVCAPAARDVEGVLEAFPGGRIVLGVRGLPHQRNAIMEAASDLDAVVFFDDDFVACARYLENTERIFLHAPDVVMTTGHVLADGILGPGFSVEEAISRLLASGEVPAGEPLYLHDVYNGYGCNMSVRLAPVKAHRLAFDEALPLYAWLEDVDFSRCLAAHGRIVRSPATRGVHMGVKAGRQSGVRLGYSQIANPIYLMGKRSVSWRRVVPLMSRNLAANLIRSVNPEPYVDRLGRLAGNVRALGDLCRGRLNPSRILSFET